MPRNFENDPAAAARMSELITDFTTLVPAYAEREPLNPDLTAHIADAEGYAYVTRKESVRSADGSGQTIYTDYRVDEHGKFTKYREVEDHTASALLDATEDERKAHQELMVATIQATEGLSRDEAWTKLLKMAMYDMASLKNGASFLIEHLKSDQEEEDMGLHDVGIEEAETLMQDLRLSYPAK